MIEKDDFIEWCNVHTNMYGTAKSQINSIREAKQIPLLDIDIQGTVKFLKAFPETNTLFVFPPSIKVLEQRLRSRGTDSEETIKTRIINSKSEIEQGFKAKDQSCLIGYKILNADLVKATEGFLRFFECLYESELKQQAKAIEPTVDADVLEARARLAAKFGKV